MESDLNYNGPVLVYRERGKTKVIHADAVSEIWYSFNFYGWMHANCWRFQKIGESIRAFEITKHPNVNERLLQWAVAYLPNFDAARFKGVEGQPGSADDEDVLVWSRDANKKTFPADFIN